MSYPIALFLLPVFLAATINAAPPVRGAMVVTDKTAPFFHAAQADPNGTDYLLFKGNTVDLLKKESLQCYVKLPTGQAGLVASDSLEVRVTPKVRPLAVSHRKPTRTRSQQRARKVVGSDRETVLAPVFRY